MDTIVPLANGPYRLYHESTYARIRIIEIEGEAYKNLFVGICTSIAEFDRLTVTLELNYDKHKYRINGA